MKKVQRFVDLFMEHVVRPIIAAKISHKDALLSVLGRMQVTIDAAALTQSSDAIDECLEVVQARTTGAAAIVSRGYVALTLS